VLPAARISTWSSNTYITCGKYDIFETRGSVQIRPAPTGRLKFALKDPRQTWLWYPSRTKCLRRQTNEKWLTELVFSLEKAFRNERTRGRTPSAAHNAMLESKAIDAIA
jgi:hypothetical protein